MKRKTSWRQILQVFFAIAGLFLCYRLIVESARSGISRLFSTVAIVESRIQPADKAVTFAPNDPEAHYTRALTLVNLGRLDEAIGEFQMAIRLRPHHYYEWLDLGVTLDRKGDQVGAAGALREAIRLAPFFAQPHWQLGSLLYRQEKYDEAFAELRLGVESNPNLIDGMLDLAWIAADGNSARMDDFIRPRTSLGQLKLARFLVSHGKGPEGALHAIAAGKPQDEDEAAVLREIISKLLGARQFSDAYAVWAARHEGAERNVAKASGNVLNGSFVDPIMQNDPGFGWQLPKVPGASPSIDPSGPSAGTRSLRIDFSGDIAPGTQVLYQLVLLEPNSHYSLKFMVKSEKLVTGGPPVVVVHSADSDTVKTLGQSRQLALDSDGTWNMQQIDFSTDETTRVASISLQRLPCSQGPCPIFGGLWLSVFSLDRK